MNQPHFPRDAASDTGADFIVPEGASIAGEARAFRWIRPLVGFTLLLLAVQEAVSLSLGTAAPHDYLRPTMQAPTALGAFVLACILVKPPDRRRMLLLGLAIEGTRIALQLLTGRPLVNLVLFPGFGLGVAAWCVLAWRAAISRGAERQRSIDILAAALALPVGNLLLWPSVFSMIPFLPHLYDNALLRLDATLGVQPAALVGALLREVPPLFALHLFVYVQLPLALCIVAALEAKSGRRLGLGLLPASLAAAAIGYLLYIAMPAVGPRPYFGDDFAAVMQQLDVLPSGPVANTTHPRNVMPSLHITWALLIYLTARQQGRRVEIAAIVFAITTALATLGLGEHYLIDLVVAVPLVLLVRALCAFDVPLARVERWGAIALGTASLACWALIVRSGNDALAFPELVPLLMGGSVLACFAAERALLRSERSLPAPALWPMPTAVGKPR